MDDDQINAIFVDTSHVIVFFSNKSHACSCVDRPGNGDNAPNLRQGFWDRLGTDEALMPKHLPFGLTADEQGPATGDDIDHWGCWCGNEGCPLDKALREASGNYEWVNRVGLTTWTHYEDGRHCLKHPETGAYWWLEGRVPHLCDRDNHEVPVQTDSQGFRIKDEGE